MSIWQAILLGIIQGLTEFLPVSSSGHIELGKSLLGVSVEGDLTFTVAVHGATVLSTVMVLWPELKKLLLGVFQLKWNDEMQYGVKIALSMLPVAIVGLALHDTIESLFEANLLLVGLMLILTAVLLATSSLVHRAAPATQQAAGPSYWNALLMGIGQAVAVLPGLSRSGTTIAMGLMGGTNRGVAAKFSFLMVIPPILGMNLLEIVKADVGAHTIALGPLIAGFLSAFICGYFACRWMINLVQRGKLVWFALYCAAVGSLAVLLHKG